MKGFSSLGCSLWIISCDSLLTSPTGKQIALPRGDWHSETQERWDTAAEGPRAPFGSASWQARLLLSLLLPPPCAPFPSLVEREGSLSILRSWVIPESSIACVGLILQHSLSLQTSESDMSPQGCLYTLHWAKPSL